MMKHATQPAAAAQVCQLPRHPFLPHSKRIFDYLCRQLPQEASQVLEIGCGPQSLLPAWLQELGCNAKLLQIDALPDAVAAARAHTPHANVQKMLASDMSSIDMGSIDAIVAMSVFDQNPFAALPQIASQIRNVLRPGGIVVYLHNEELNMPATAASILQASGGKRILLPSDSWQIGNDLDYCSVSRGRMEQLIAAAPHEFPPLLAFLKGIYAYIYDRQGNQPSTARIDVPFLRKCTPKVMADIRACVGRLRADAQIELEDLPISDLVSRHIESGLLSGQHGFEVIESGVFELSQVDQWSRFLNERPEDKFFVRGLGRWGYSSQSEVPSAVRTNRTLYTPPELDSPDELAFIGQQYGIVARRV